MNLREFCQEREYPFTLALTYSFDPVFFDRVPLNALWAGGAQETLIFADGGEVDRALERVRGPIHHLGRRYLLAPVRMPGAFHPKLLLRLGQEGGIVALGSGNLTHGGWGLNAEVVTAWRLGPGFEDSGGWIPSLLQRGLEWSDSPLVERALARIREIEWLKPGPGGRILLSGPASLGTQLRERWAGRTFTRLRFVTGSTDRDGRVLRWLNETFGVEEAMGCVTPERCSWVPESMGSLPLELSLVAQASPVVHAKAYHLSGPDGDVLLIGSANCSPSAWIRPPGDGGNIESLLLYENPTSVDLAVLDDLLGEEQERPAEVLTAPLQEDPPVSNPSPPLDLAGLQVDADGVVMVRLRGGVREDWVYELHFGNQVLPLHLTAGVLEARPPEKFPAGETAFGHVEARTPEGRTLRSARRWVDDLRLLHETSAARNINRMLRDLPKSDTGRRDDQLIHDLNRIAHDLIHDSRAIPDPFARRGRKKTEDSGNGKAPPVDPHALIRSLMGEPVPLAHPTYGSEGRDTSLTGVFRALFGGTAEDEEHEVSEEEEEASRSVGNGESPPGTDPSPPPLEAEPVGDRNRKRFEQHLDRFMEALHEPAFRERCTATQLVQTIGYPFAATALGMERGWTDPERARLWLVRASRLLLEPGSDGAPPLLEQVRRRYEEDDARDLFERIVGEGTLWVTMAAGLSGVRWPGQEPALQRMLLIRRLWETETLRAHADSAHLEQLIHRYRAGDAVAGIRDIAAPTTAALSEAEERLRSLSADLLELQAETRTPVQPGELLWGPRNGWAIAVEVEVEGNTYVYWPKRGEVVHMVMDRYFVSLPQAAAVDGQLARAFDDLVEVFRRLVLS